MVLNYAKIALITSFTLLADAKKGKYGYRKNVDETDEIVNDNDGDFVADSWDAQEDSDRPDIEMDLKQRLKDRKKKNDSKKPWKKNKKGSPDKDFARGVLQAIVEAVAETD